MSENLLQTMPHLIQDVIAPDVRELKVRMSAVERSIESLEKHMDVRFTTADQKGDAQFKAIMAAISESKAQGELASFRVIAALSERVAVLESRRQ